MLNDEGPSSEPIFLDLSSAFVEAGSASICKPGEHRWVAITITPGLMLGQDEEFNPVFMPDDRFFAETAYGCEICDEAWRPSFSGSVS